MRLLREEPGCPPLPTKVFTAADGADVAVVDRTRLGPPGSRVVWAGGSRAGLPELARRSARDNGRSGCGRKHDAASDKMRSSKIPSGPVFLLSAKETGTEFL